MANQEGKSKKKNYKSPRLISYGSFKKLTQSKGGSKTDGGSKPATKNANPNA